MSLSPVNSALKTILQHTGLTQYQLAAALGVHTAHLSNLFSGKRTVTRQAPLLYHFCMQFELFSPTLDKIKKASLALLKQLGIQENPSLCLLDCPSLFGKQIVKIECVTQGKKITLYEKI